MAATYTHKQLTVPAARVQRKAWYDWYGRGDCSCVVVELVTYHDGLAVATQCVLQQLRQDGVTVRHERVFAFRFIT